MTVIVDTPNLAADAIIDAAVFSFDARGCSRHASEAWTAIASALKGAIASDRLDDLLWQGGEVRAPLSAEAIEETLVALKRALDPTLALSVTLHDSDWYAFPERFFFHGDRSVIVQTRFVQARAENGQLVIRMGLIEENPGTPFESTIKLHAPVANPRDPDYFPDMLRPATITIVARAN